jgi:predicted DNA-binding ribbon-helix-helix protein
VPWLECIEAAVKNRERVRNARRNACIRQELAAGVQAMTDSLKRTTKRSITIKNHKTSVSLENEFWDCLREIALERGVSLQALVAAIDANRQHPNLSSAIRIFVLQFYRYQLQTRTAPLGTPTGGLTSP